MLIRFVADSLWRWLFSRWVPGRKALKELQIDKPAYQSGADGWWAEVIRRTAVGAGADPSGEQTYRETGVPLSELIPVKRSTGTSA